MLPRKLTAEDIAAGRISSGITTDAQPPSLAEEKQHIDRAMQRYEENERRLLWRGTFYALVIIAVGAILVWLSLRYL
jgi:hypothetical protein